jgi:hypothetical protein
MGHWDRRTSPSPDRVDSGRNDRTLAAERRGLTHLKSLSLDGALVSDSSLDYLKNLAGLESLLLAFTDVT